MIRMTYAHDLTETGQADRVTVMHTTEITIRIPNPIGGIKARKAAKVAKAERIVEIDAHIAELNVRRENEYARDWPRRDFIKIYDDKLHELALERIGLVYGR